MDLLQLRYFVTVASLEHMSKAADELHISQPTLSQVIKRLEDELGVPLFTRNGRHIKLNDNGKYLLEHATFILSYIEQTQNELQRGTNGSDAQIIIHFNHGQKLFSPLLKSFQKKYPYVNFQVSTSKKPDPDSFLIDTEYESARHDAHRFIYEDEILLLVSSDSPLAKQAQVEVSSLKNYDFINNKNNFLKEITQPFCEKAGFVPRFSYTTDTPYQITEIISSNLGISFWPKSRMDAIDYPGIVAVPLCRPYCYRSFYICWSSKKILNRTEQLFIDFCSTYF